MIGLNNPFNIRYVASAHWKGINEKNPSTKGFCNFISRDYGIRAALYLLIRSYRKQRINTIECIIHRFAPSVENNTSNYIKFVEDKTKIDRLHPLSNIFEYCMVLFAMSIFEGNRVEFTDIYYTFIKFNKIENLKIYDNGKA